MGADLQIAEISLSCISDWPLSWLRIISRSCASGQAKGPLFLRFLDLGVGVSGPSPGTTGTFVRIGASFIALTVRS